MIELLFQRISSPSCCTKNLILAIKTKIIRKLTKIGKKLPKSDKHMYNFMKQNDIEVERGVEYKNYQREAAILTDF